jgi:hypothetical protein
MERRFAAHLHTIKARGWLRVKRDLIMHALWCADARNEVVSRGAASEQLVLLRAGFWPQSRKRKRVPIPGGMFIRSKRRRPCIKRREFLEYLDPGLRKVGRFTSLLVSDSLAGDSAVLRARGLHGSLLVLVLLLPPEQEKSLRSSREPITTMSRIQEKGSVEPCSWPARS